MYVYASQQHAKLRTNDRGVDKRLRQEVTTRKAASCSTENSCRTREAQAYIPPTARDPASCSTDDPKRYILAHARDTVYERFTVTACAKIYITKNRASWTTRLARSCSPIKSLYSLYTYKTKF